MDGLWIDANIYKLIVHVLQNTIMQKQLWTNYVIDIIRSTVERDVDSEIYKYEMT